MAESSKASLNSCPLTNLGTSNKVKVHCQDFCLRSGSRVGSVCAHKYVQIVKPANFYFNPIVFSVGPVPVVILPKLSLYIGFNGLVSAGVTASVTQEASISAGLSYSSGQWTPISDFSNVVTQFYRPTFSGEVTARAYVGPEFQILLYGLAGPTAYINGYLQFDAMSDMDPSWILSGGIYTNIGVKMEILSRVLADYNKTVIDYNEIIL